MTKFYAPFLASVVRTAALLVVLSLTSLANAVTLFWDADSSLAGAGTWDANSTQNWKTTNTAGAPDAKWSPNDGTVDASFGGALIAPPPQDGTGSTNGRPSISGTINVNSITFAPTTGTYDISGGTLNIASPTNSIVMNTNATGAARAQVISSIIAGTNITVVAPNGVGGINALLSLGADGTGVTNTFSGDLIFGGPSTASSGFSQININNPTALPSTATVRMQRNLSQLLFGGGGASGSSVWTATLNNNINLNDGGSSTLNQSIGAFSNGTVITLNGVISGNANLIFQLGNAGGQGKIVLAKHETYTGSTQINTAAAGTGITALGIDDAFPVSPSLTVTRGNFDMAGFNQHVGGLAGGANGVISNTSGTTSTLTINGNVNGDYAGLIGYPGSTKLPGGSDNVALALASTNAGSLTLSNVNGNTYNGGTTINGGKLYAANPLGAGITATGSGPVAVNSGGTLGGNGSVAGAITVATGGHITGGLRTGTTIGKLTASDALSLNSGSNLDIDLGAPAPAGGASDVIDLPNSTALTVAGVHSVAVNLNDPAGGATGNGTYTLLTFQAGQFTGGTNTAFFTGSLPSPNSLNGATIAYHLADSGNVIQDATPANATKMIMQVTGGPNALVWTGGVDGTWNAGTPLSPFNFNNLNTASGTTFAGNDNVTFDDTGANTNPITVTAGGVQPNVVTINNSTKTYIFSGGDIKGSSVGGTGGLILSGTGAVTINSNYTAAGPIISNKSGAGTVALNGNITAATSLTVNGGAVTLAGANTYTGSDIINGGSLTASGASATFGKGNVTVNAGSAAISTGVTDAILDSATLTLAGGGTANMADTGFINLATGINEKVASLVLGTTTYTSGTFGATGSGASNIFDEYFLGSGIVTVGAAGLPGDINGDGHIDAQDYVFWRKNGLPQSQYDAWRAHFGSPPGAGSSLSGGNAVPEPATLLLSLVMVGSLLVVGRRKR